MACCQQRFSKSDPPQNIDPVYFCLAYFACSDVFEVWVKKMRLKRKMAIQREIHNVDRGDVGIAHVVLQALPSSKVLQKGFDSGLCWKNRTMAVQCHTPPYHHISTSKPQPLLKAESQAVLAYNTQTLLVIHLLKIDCTIMPRNSWETSVIHHFMLLHPARSLSMMPKCWESNVILLK